MDNVVLETVGPENLAVRGIGCLANTKSEGFRQKTAWLEERFDEGLRMLMARDGAGETLGFLEFVPGEYAWRPVEAQGWLFVHCLWVFSRGQRVGGIGCRLIQRCVEEARQAQAIGVVAMVSDGSWMVGKSVYLKCGFTQIAEADRFQLVAYRLGDGPEPKFRQLGSRYVDEPGLQIVYSAQCPLLSKSVHDLAEVADECGLGLKITEMKTAHEAQDAPTYYGVFTLLWNGRVLSDHYVSKTRFKSILAKEGLGGRPKTA